MSERVWIICGASGDLTPGRFRARIVKGGPMVPVEIIETAPTDVDGNVIGDAVYAVWVNGRLVPDWEREFPQGLIGEPDTLRTEPTDDTGKVDLIKAPLPF